MQTIKCKSHQPDEFFLSDREEACSTSNKSFAAFIKDYRKHWYNSKGKPGISTKELAECVGIGPEMFRKILNKQKPNQSRDCIIAICAALAMDEEDTNEALRLYQFMPKLDIESPRDNLIIQVLSGGFDDLISIDAVNARLQRYGLPALDIINHRDRVGKRTCIGPQKSFPYLVLKKNVKTVTTEHMYDQYNSFESAYSFKRYKCIATMWLDDSVNKKIYILTVGPNDGYHLETRPWSAKPFKSFKTIEDTGDFMDYFQELKSMARSEQCRIEEYLNDTRNYYERLSAKIWNESIHVFMEKYNYTIPERNEYYLFEYIDGVYRLSVAHKSLFMRKYLTEEEYKEHYGEDAASPFESYDTLEAIEGLWKDSKSSEESNYILKLRASVYRKMKVEIDKCLEQLRNREVFVRNLEYIYDDRDRVCAYYGVADEFKCELDHEQGDVMTAGVDSANIITEYGQTITLEISDLYRAFELGFNSADEMCRVKKTKGSIEAVLK